jgi:hypothetical protein
MSNKTQLQTNNTALDGYIARINAAKEVAASLPEAGGSGGGGSIETCTVTINGDGPLFGNEIIYYSNGTGALQSSDFPDFAETITISVQKNSILVDSGSTVLFPST